MGKEIDALACQHLLIAQVQPNPIHLPVALHIVDDLAQGTDLRELVFQRFIRHGTVDGFLQPGVAQ